MQPNCSTPPRHEKKNSFRAQRLLSLLLCTVFVLYSTSLGSAADEQVAKRNSKLNVLNQVDIDQRLNAKVPLSLSFHDADGKTVTLAELCDGKPLILNLAYYRCPMLCNRTRDGLVKTLRTLEFAAGKEFDVITVSFDPQETAQLANQVKQITLAQYDRPGSETGWHFLTGNQESIAQLAESVGFRFAWDDRTGRYAHAAGIIILTPNGHVSRYLNGVDFAARDVRLSLIEASSGEIGSPTDQVLLLCYQYDPARGKYGLAIMNVLRISGVLTVLGLIAGIGLLIRRDRGSAGRVPASDTTQNQPIQDSASNS